MKPEEEARQHIDELLNGAGWNIQNYKDINLGASLGVAVREFPTDAGPVDYMLFLDRKAVGVLEAKPYATTLSGVAEQTEKYAANVPIHVANVRIPLPFAYESTGINTCFRDGRDPVPRSRSLFAFHKPETLMAWLATDTTCRANLRNLPALPTQSLWGCQVEAIQNLEKSFADARPRALIQMATGSGKTYTAVTITYRLIKYARAKRILFLVDRNTLGRQTKNEFAQYVTPDDGRKFSQLYNVQHLTSNTLDPVSKVCISTIQRLYSMLSGEPELDSEIEEQSQFEIAPPSAEERTVSYNPDIPISTFDFIFTDECHRSIYNLWRQVLEYFDAFVIGLTATPSKQTLGFFNQNLVMEYGHDRAIADGVNVGYDVYRIKTKITEDGSTVDAGYYVDKRDKLTRKLRWEELDEDLEYTAKQLDRDVVSPSQIRTVIRTFRDRLFTDIFPGRRIVPKTLVFAKDDSHAEDIVKIIREEFAQGNEFCKKITYKTTGEKTENLIKSFRNSYFPRIAVTVDMISTGTDIKPLECLFFMRDVRSRVYFEQMKGRGTRVIDPNDLRAVTSDADTKTHFVIVDAIGVCENDKTDSRPLERKRTVPFHKLVLSVATGARDTDTLTSLAGRLARLDQEIDESERQEIQATIDGRSLKEIINDLLSVVDPDEHIEKAKAEFGTIEPTPAQVKEAAERMIQAACRTFDNPEFRNTVIEIRKRKEQVIDTVSPDVLIYAGSDPKASEKAQAAVETFKKFIEDNKDELTGLQIIYSKPYSERHLTYEQIKQLAEAIRKPPYQLTSEGLWAAYERLEKAKVRKAGPQKLLTDIVSLIRFALGHSEVLEPFSDTVERRFGIWIEAQQNAGHEFTPEQTAWLAMIKDHIATSASIDKNDLEYAPFHERGGMSKAYHLFGEKLDKILGELSETLVA